MTDRRISGKSDSRPRREERVCERQMMEIATNPRSIVSFKQVGVLSHQHVAQPWLTLYHHLSNGGVYHDSPSRRHRQLQVTRETSYKHQSYFAFAIFELPVRHRGDLYFIHILSDPVQQSTNDASLPTICGNKRMGSLQSCRREERVSRSSCRC